MTHPRPGLSDIPPAPTRRKSARPAAALIVIFSLAGPAAAGAAGPPTKPADAPRQAFDRVYGPRLKKVAATPGREDDVALAKELLKDATDLPPGTPLQPLLLDKAYELGMRDCDGVETAIAAAQTLTRLDPANVPAAGEKLLAAYEFQSNCPRADRRKCAEAYLNQVTEVAARRTAAADYNGAVALYQRATPAAKSLGPDRLRQHQEQTAALRAGAAVRKQADRLRAALRGSAGTSINTGEAARAAELVRLLVVELDDPAAAGEFTGQLQDAALTRVVRLAIRGPDQLDETEAKELGDWYRTRAETAAVGKATALARARTAYDRALSLHPAHDAGWLELRAAAADAAAAGARLAGDKATGTAAGDRPAPPNAASAPRPAYDPNGN